MPKEGKEGRDTLKEKPGGGQGMADAKEATPEEKGQGGAEVDEGTGDTPEDTPNRNARPLPGRKPTGSNEGLVTPTISLRAQSKVLQPWEGPGPSKHAPRERNDASELVTECNKARKFSGKTTPYLSKYLMAPSNSLRSTRIREEPLGSASSAAARPKGISRPPCCGT